MKKRLQEKKEQASGLVNEDSSVTPASHLIEGLPLEKGEEGLAHGFKAVVAQPQTSAVEENNRKSRTHQVAIAEIANLRAALEQPETTPLSELPLSIRQLLEDALEELEGGHAVRVLPVHAELSVAEAADILGLAQPLVISLLEQRDIPAAQIAGEYRIRLEEVVLFAQTQKGIAYRALQQMADLAQELEMP
ncbi:helix-turn-helix domain-containing protein (plasmid) [Deinococcus sp. VB343]|uniref:Helix-turn-helix domain-containing protein n=1 Tax=Deinococcus sp. VB142 TaxID=3112952 RepID=A0AAU6Q964_9DEIO